MTAVVSNDALSVYTKGHKVPFFSENGFGTMIRKPIAEGGGGGGG